jgi:hypothetical protein
MDSNIVTMIDPYVKKYILTIRNPIDLAVSYKSLFRTRQSLDQFTKTLIINKLLCYGDIVERWYNLVDPNKILIYNYDNILEDNQAFITKLTNQLSLPTPNFINLAKINRSNNKIYEPLSESNLAMLQFQTAKFEKITNLSLNYIINN